MTLKEFLAPFYASGAYMDVNLMDGDHTYFLPVKQGCERAIPSRLLETLVKQAKLDVVDGTPVMVINEVMKEDE